MEGRRSALPSSREGAKPKRKDLRPRRRHHRCGRDTRLPRISRYRARTRVPRLTLDRKSAAPPYGFLWMGVTFAAEPLAAWPSISGWLGACSSTAVNSAGTGPVVVGTGAGSVLPLDAAVGHMMSVLLWRGTARAFRTLRRRTLSENLTLSAPAATCYRPINQHS